MNLLSVRREVGEFRKRYKWMALVVVVSFSVVLVRLLQLQVLEHSEWRAEARRNITRKVRLPATRGVLRDAEGRVLAANRPSYDVYMTPQLLDADDLKRIAELMQLDAPAQHELRKRLDAIPRHRRNHLIEMFTDVTRDQFAALKTHQRELPGVEVVAVPVRTYPFGSLGAHAVGYLNEVNQQDLESLSSQNYRPGQKIGRNGLERAWESYLRGRDGMLKVVVDVRGREVRTGPRLERHADRREPIPGRDLETTLNMRLMRALKRAFRGHPSGGAVVVDVRTGRVRALFSKPSYDLNEMSGRLTPERARELRENPFRPLIDKTIYETYYPGSTFKPISAIAALQDEVLPPTHRVDCPGFYKLGRRRFRCSHSHGDTDMRKAIVQSCNVFFYKLAEQVGLNRLERYGKEFGLGTRTGIGINTEASGFLPTREWYVEQYQQRYRLGFTLNAAIGQGNTRVTLIQLAMAYAAIANGGTLYVPQLAERILSPDGEVIEAFPPRVRRRVEVDREHLAYMVDALYGVVNDRKGTAHEAMLKDGVPVAGKTGTAQVARRKLPEGEDPSRAWYYRRSHAWFAGFAPAGDPELVAVVLVEHGGRGGKYAAPIAIQALQEALGDAHEEARAEKQGRKGTLTARRSR